MSDSAYWNRRVMWSLGRIKSARRTLLTGLTGFILLAAFGAGQPPKVSQWPASRIEPIAQYREWWEATKRCSGLNGRFSRIRWYRMIPAGPIPTEHGPKVGLWFEGVFHSRILLASEYVSSELVVRHEMLHELLGTGDHPPEYFERRCRLTWETFAWPATESIRLSR